MSCIDAKKEDKLSWLLQPFKGQERKLRKGKERYLKCLVVLALDGALIGDTVN